MDSLWPSRLCQWCVIEPCQVIGPPGGLRSGHRLGRDPFPGRSVESRLLRASVGARRLSPVSTSADLHILCCKLKWDRFNSNLVENFPRVKIRPTGLEKWMLSSFKLIAGTICRSGQDLRRGSRKKTSWMQTSHRVNRAS